MSASTAQSTTTSLSDFRPPPLRPPPPPPPSPYDCLMECHKELLNELSYNLATFRNIVVEADTLRFQNSQLRGLIENLKICKMSLTEENAQLRHANMSLIEENAKLWHGMKVEQVPKSFSFYVDPSRSASRGYGEESSRADGETSKEVAVGEVSAAVPTEIAVNLCDVGIHVKGGYDLIEQKVHSQGSPKTKMCKTWKYFGSCSFGDDCKFAHGIAELRPILRPHDYKVYPCPNIMNGVPCPDDDRCYKCHILTEEKLQVLQRND